MGFYSFYFMLSWGFNNILGLGGGACTMLGARRVWGLYHEILGGFPQDREVPRELSLIALRTFSLVNRRSPTMEHIPSQFRRFTLVSMQKRRFSGTLFFHFVPPALSNYFPNRPQKRRALIFLS